MGAALRSRLTLVSVLLILTTGCSISADSSPHDVPADKQAEQPSPDPVSPGQATAGDERIFLIGPDDRLQTVFRRAEGTLRSRIESLRAGPNDEDRARGLRSFVPSDLEINDLIPGPVVTTIDIGRQLFELQPSEQVMAIAQLVYTASQLNPQAEVVIKVDGDAQEWPNGAGTLQSGALTIYDYYGLAITSQPDYPQRTN